MKAAQLWPAAVVGTLALTVGVNVVMLVLANDGDRAVVEPRYYEKAVAWDSTMADAARSEATGWKADAALSELARPARGALLRVRLLDRNARPVEGATMHVEAIHNLDAGRRVEAAVGFQGDGVYEARLPLDRHGLWELRLRADRGSDHYEADIRRDLIAAAGEGGARDGLR